MEIKIDKEVLDKMKHKASEIAEKAKHAANSSWEWLKANRNDLMGMIPLALGAVGVVKAFKPSFGERERARKDTEYWNPHDGHRWQLKRKPTNAEWAEISRRQRLGEYDEVILKDLNLLR